MIDHHAHPFDRERGPLQPTRLAIDVDDPAGGRSEARVWPDTVWRALFVSRLARRLGVPIDDVPPARAEAAADYPAYVRGLFADAGIEQLVLDPAWPAGSEAHVGDFARLSGCAVHVLWRLEPLVDELLANGAGADDVVDGVDERIAVATTGRYRGFKSVIAYRTGLAVDPDVTVAHARSALGRGGRLAAKPLYDLAFQRLLEAAAETALPVQIHTGFGDSDLRLGSANPTLLEPVLDTSAGRRAPVVLLHSGFPFQDEASYLAAARSNVHVDLSLVNLFAPANLADGLLRVIGVAPLDRVLFGTDAYVLPEAFWFAAGMLREAWREVRARLLTLGVDPGWADEAEQAVFGDNARRLYRLDHDDAKRADAPRDAGGHDR